MTKRPRKLGDFKKVGHANPCYVWLYYDWLFVFDCICAVLRGSLLYISVVEINEELLLLITIAINLRLNFSLEGCVSRQYQ